MAENTIFEETQRLHQNAIVRYVVPISCGFTLVLTGTVMMARGSAVQDIVVAFGLLVGLPVLMALMPMHTVVTPEEVRVRTLVFYRKRIAIESIVFADAIRYNPIVSCGGWGVRTSRTHGLVLNISGDRGVLVGYRSDRGERTVLIGSRRSEGLADAIGVAAGLGDGLAHESPEHGGASSFAV